MNIGCWKTWVLVLMLAAGGAWAGRGADTNVLVWQADRNQVSADIHGEALWPLLEDIAHQTGWHVFVEPGASHQASVKFRNLTAGEALQKLLGDLNYAFVPNTNGPQELYVFSTTIQKATQKVVAARKPVVRRHVANQLMVRLKPGANIDAIAKAHHAKVISRNDKLGIYLLEFSNESATDAALASLQNDSGVASVDYNYLFNSPVSPQPLAGASGSAGLSLNLDANNTSDPCNPVIGLIDTGTQSLGTSLDAFMMKSVNVTGDTTSLSSTTPTHGTAMAQTILQAVAQQGKSSSVRILPVDVYGNGETATSWNVALGVQAAVDGGATVLNMSLAGTTDGAVLDDIIKQAVAKGIVIFAAAGNEPVTTPNYPAALTGVNAVTAVDSSGQLASYADYGSFVDMALPGSSVVYMGDQAWMVQGTSSATAYATGVAAGTKASDCASWTDIQAAMVKKFTVPQKSN